MSVEKAGRLDRLLGVGVAETLRRFFGISYKHTSAGGEWPHCYGSGHFNAEQFWSLAIELDRSRVDGSLFRDEVEITNIQAILDGRAN